MSPASPPEELGELADACRGLAREGHNDFTLGHLSLRDPHGRGFWLKKPGRGLDEVAGAADFHLLDWDGGNGVGEPAHIEWPIHAGVLQARPTLQVVGHTHPYWGHLASCRAEPLRLIGNEGAAFTAGIPRFDATPDLISSAGLGRDVALALGDARAVLLAHHGVVFGGASIAEAVLTGLWLERLCRSNLLLGDGKRSRDIITSWSRRQRERSPTQPSGSTGPTCAGHCPRVRKREAVPR